MTKEKESKKSKSSRSGEKKSTTRKQKSKQEGRFRNGRNYGLKYWSKIWPTYKYSAIIVTILVIVPTSILFTYPSLFVNPNEQFETPYSYQIGNEYGTNESLFISGSGAVVSSLSVQIDYWFNWSQFYDASTLWFLYYSGEHDDYYNASEEISIGSTNYINWWTFSTYIGKPDFSTSSIDTTYEEIPPHDAETKVTFQFLMEEWNGTQWTFKEWNGTYTVLYNHNEIEYEHNLYQTFWFYLSVGLYFIAATVVVVRPFKINDKKESMDDEKSPDEVKPKPFDPTVEYLASRCNQLDKNRSNFRTGVGIMLTLSIGLVAFLLPSDNLTILFSGFFFGVILMAFSALSAILFSFSSLTIKDEGWEIRAGLIPEGQSELLYKKQLIEAIRVRERIISRMSISMGLGFVMLFVLIGVSFIFSLLPSPTFSNEVINSNIAYLFAFCCGFAFFLVLSTILFGRKGLHMYWEEFSD